MCSEAPVPRCANLSDPSEYVSKQNLGDSFPLADKFDFSEKVGFGMGQVSPGALRHQAVFATQRCGHCRVRVEC